MCYPRRVHVRDEGKPDGETRRFDGVGVVERSINRLTQWRGLAIRYEKRAVNYYATVMLASIVLWLEAWCAGTP